MSLSFRKKIRIVAIILLLAAAVFVQQTLSVYFYSRRAPQHKADAAIVLGAAAWGKKPSPVLRERINHALTLYRQGYCRFIIFTGGAGAPGEPGESLIARSYAIQQGIPARAIIVENRSRTTWQNINNTAALISGTGIRTCYLVSDPYHLKRASVIASHLGLTVYPAATPTSLFKSTKVRRDFLLRESWLLILLRTQIFLYNLTGNALFWPGNNW
jgi:uncharacterized SAM-binding protein YcdF (DUF218 family)